MIYILEASILDDSGDNVICVYGIKYTKRRSAYLENSSIYSVVKLLKGRGFNEKVKDYLLSTLEVFKGSNFSYRSNYIKINSITKSIIDNINTISDITNLTDIVEFLAIQDIFNSYKQCLFTLSVQYINRVELLDHNWDLIQTVYHKSGRDLIKEMLATKETDLFKYMLDTYGIDLVDLPKVSPKVDREFIRRFLQIEDSNSHLEERHIEIYQVSRLLRCCTRIDGCKS
jgi:hypothetical protein